MPNLSDLKAMTIGLSLFCMLGFSSTSNMFATAQSIDPAVNCGSFSIVAAPSLSPLVQAWVSDYKEKKCPNVKDIPIETGGSSQSLARVCGTASMSAGAVEIGGTTRVPFRAEAETEDDWRFSCERSTRGLIGVSRFLSWPDFSAD